MTPLWEVYAHLLPLIGFAFLGYFLGKRLEFDQKTLASILVYMLSPMVVFGSIAQSDITITDLLLPSVVLALTTSFSFLSSIIAKRFFEKKKASLVTFCSAIPNTGFFGIPIVSVLLGETALAHQVLLAYIGVGITCYTSALYFLAAGSFSVRDSVQQLFRMPFLYALVLGLSFSFLDISVHQLVASAYDLAKGAFIVIAMLVMGSVARRITSGHFDWPTFGAIFFVRYLIWPLAIGGVLLLDHYWSFFGPEARIVLACNAFVPVALNSVNFSLVLGIESTCAAAAVVGSTVLSFLLVPLVVYMFT